MIRCLVSSLLVLTFVVSTSAQSPVLPVNPETGKITYTAIVKVDSLFTKEILFQRATKWFAQTYKSAQDVIQLQDKETGMLVGKGVIPVYYQSMGVNQQDGYMNYTFTLQVKDGRYRYELTNIYHQPNPGGNNYGTAEEMQHTKKAGYQKILNRMLEQVNSNVDALIQSLSKAMRETPKTDDW